MVSPVDDIPPRTEERDNVPRVEEMDNTYPIVVPSTEEELWAEYDKAMWMALPTTGKARQLAAQKREMDEGAKQEAAMERVRAEEHELWLATRAHSTLVEQDARSTAMSSVGAKRLTNAWRYQDHVYIASE